jgi:hypothetical protein
MGVFGMWVFGVHMVVAMIMGVAVGMTMCVIMIVRMGVIVAMPLHIQSADPRAKILTLRAIFDVTTGGIRALTLNVVVMAFLYGPDFSLKPQDLRAVFAGAAGGRNLLAQLFGDALRKGFKHAGVIPQIARFYEFNVGMCGGDLIGKAIDPINKNAREQEIWKHDDAFIAKLCNMGQTRLYQGEGHARIANFTPAKAHPLPQHPCDFAHVAVGIGVRGTASDDDQTGLLNRNLAKLIIGTIYGFLHPRTSGGDHLRINAQFAPIRKINAVFSRISIENCWNIIFGVHCRKEHTWNGDDAITPAFSQTI